MSRYQDVFARKEVKYLLTDSQYTQLTERLQGIAEVDAYGKTNIRNIYFDTPDFALIRRSLEKPAYKEKLRLRSYGAAGEDTPSFVEIKKKYKGIVYKRRIGLSYHEAEDYLFRGIPVEHPSQISGEIDYFLARWSPLVPAMSVYYDRIALAGTKDPALRITFDTNILWSAEEWDLRRPIHGTPVLSEGQHLMELKIQGAMDLHLSYLLDALDIRPVSFSKYGRSFVQYEAMQAAAGIRPDLLLGEAAGARRAKAQDQHAEPLSGAARHHTGISSGHGQEVRYA